MDEKTFVNEATGAILALLDRFEDERSKNIALTMLIGILIVGVSKSMKDPVLFFDDLRKRLEKVSGE